MNSSPALSRTTLFFFATLVAHLGCGRKVPAGVKPVLETHRAEIVKIAEEAAKMCPSAKLAAPFQKDPSAAPRPGASPAKGSSLESDARVLDVFIMCSWPDPRDPSGATWAGTGLSSLRATTQVPRLPVTMPDDLAENTCNKSPHNCIQVVVPSRHSKAAQSVDVRVKRPTPDGGDVEVTAILEIP